MPGQNQFLSFNPFHNIYRNETSEYIHAHTLRSGYTHKLSDTFTVFSGTRIFPFYEQDERHVGIFDWLTLGIPWLLDESTRWCFQNFNENDSVGLRVIALLGIIPTSIISGITNTLRYSLASAFTLAASPLVLGIHIVSRLITLKEHSDIDKLALYTNRIGPVADNIFDANYEGTAQQGKLSFTLNELGNRKKLVIQDFKNLQSALFLNIGGLSQKFGKVSYSFFKEKGDTINTNLVDPNTITPEIK